MTIPPALATLTNKKPPKSLVSVRMSLILMELFLPHSTCYFFFFLIWYQAARAICICTSVAKLLAIPVNNRYEIFCISYLHCLTLTRRSKKMEAIRFCLRHVICFRRLYNMID